MRARLSTAHQRGMVLESASGKRCVGRGVSTEERKQRRGAADGPCHAESSRRR
jgi:hypothetical protein